jgi:hypothetical protein
MLDKVIPDNCKEAIDVTKFSEKDQETFANLLEEYFKTSMLKELAKRQAQRIPSVFIPNALKKLPIVADKDANFICRAVVYKPQLEDALKACRR